MRASGTGHFGQLTPSGRERRLAVDVQQPGLQLVQPAPDRVPVLVDEHHVPGVVQRDDHHRAGVVDDLALGDGAVAHPHRVDPQAEDLPAVDLSRGDDLLSPEPV